MKMRWLAAGLTAVLITGGAATVAQRVITQKTRGVLPEINDAAHPDARRADLVNPPKLAVRSAEQQPSSRVNRPEVELSRTRSDVPATQDTLPLPAVAPEPSLLAEEIPPSASQPVVPTVAISETPATPSPADPASPATAPGTEGSPTPGGSARESAVTDAEARPASASSATPNPLPRDVPVAVDPVDSVESFVERNRKEAEESIKTLTSEAENLKARLIRVESALTRWQTFSRALNADQPASQPGVPATPRSTWRNPDPESSAGSKVEGQVAKPAAPTPESPPSTQPPETPANPPVPLPSDLPLPSPAEDPAASSPPALPPTLPDAPKR